MHISATEFKGLAKTSKPIAIVAKQYFAVSEPLGERQVRFVISTEAIDRDQDKVIQPGWKLDNYLKNPVVLFGHDASQLPIGKCVEIGIENDQLKATVEFVPGDIPIAGPMAEAVYQLCQKGFLSGVSVGFKPIDWDFSDDPGRANGVDFKSSELMEFSVVNIPSNPEALIISRDEPDDEDKQLNTFNTKDHLIRKIRIFDLAK